MKNFQLKIMKIKRYIAMKMIKEYQKGLKNRTVRTLLRIIFKFNQKQEKLT